MHHPNRFHIRLSLFFSVGLDFSLCSHIRRCRLSFIIALATPCPCRRPRIASVFVLALGPAHRTTRSRTHSIDIASTANSHPPPPNLQTKQHHGLPPSPSRPVITRLLCPSFRQTKQQMLNFHDKVANTFNLLGFAFFPFHLEFRAADSHQDIWQGQKSKAK